MTDAKEEMSISWLADMIEPKFELLFHHFLGQAKKPMPAPTNGGLTVRILFPSCPEETEIQAYKKPTI